jgi:hypothetical protein
MNKEFQGVRLSLLENHPSVSVIQGDGSIAGCEDSFGGHF